MKEPHELVLGGAEGLIAKSAVQAELIDSADVGEGILREEEKGSAIDFFGRFDGDAAGAVFVGFAHGQPIVFGLLIVALDVDLPGCAIFVAGPADIDNLHGLAGGDVLEMDLGGDDDLGLDDLEEALNHVGAPGVGISAQLAQLTDEAEDGANVTQLQSLGHETNPFRFESRTD